MFVLYKLEISNAVTRNVHLWYAATCLEYPGQVRI